MYPLPTECVNVFIDVNPTTIPPAPKPLLIPDKLLAIMKKYKYNWRLDQLSHPKWRERKFVPKVVKLLQYQKTKPKKLSEELKFFADHQSRPPLRTLVINKRLYRRNGRNYVNRLNRYIRKTWDSVYNYYKKKEKEKILRQQRRDAKLKSKKEKTLNVKRFTELAVPKPVFKPPPPDKPKKVFSNFEALDILAAPKQRPETPQKPLGVSPAALTYEPTEAVLKLAAPPERYKNIEKPLEPGTVPRSALRYKITPRIEVLATPKQRTEKQKIDEDFDPFAISKNALKYKATPRILELAKPLERD